MKMTKHKCIANFLIGFGSVLNFSPVMSASSLQTLQDDMQNMHNDLKQLGNDMRKGMSEVAHDYRK